MSTPTAAVVLLAGVLFGTTVSAADSPPTPTVEVSALDHVLLWTTDVDAATAALAVRLGFQVTAGGEFDDGIANRVVRFADETYVELLYFTRPAGQLEGDALAAFRYAERGTGANTFALSMADAAAMRRRLSGLGHALAPPTPDAYDPDGAGPLPAIREAWTTVAFEQPPLRASDLFFISYAYTRTPVQKADFAVLSAHPNGATRVSALWLLVEDAEAELRRLEGLGVRATHTRVSFPQIGARGISVQLDDDRILLLQPTGAGAAADALGARGPQLFGVSIETEALDRAQRLVQRGYRTKVERYEGLAGDAFLAPSRGDLGLVVEFHAARATASPAARR